MKGDMGRACGMYRGMRNAYRFWWGYLKRQLGRPRHRWEDIKS
jgi:hypothetical protein